ncbi:MAG: DNA alkylation repair protein [Bacteroidales bacterium]
MDFLLDDKRSDENFKKILHEIPKFKNGEVVRQMKQLGVEFKCNYGVSLPTLREMSARYGKDHVLALKLWNKQWRETIILATMLDESEKVTEEQVDYWLKSANSMEVAGCMCQYMMVDLPFSYAKAFEWCRGKKFIVKYAGIILTGRLSLVDKDAIDDMFEPFFEMLIPLAKDPNLHRPLFDTLEKMSRRSAELRSLVIYHCKGIGSSTTNSDCIIFMNEVLEFLSLRDC